MTLLTHPIFLYYYQWTLSCITIVAMGLASEKNKTTWTLSLLNQLLWIIYIVLSKQYGFILMNAGMWYFCIRGYLVWNHNHNPTLNAIFVEPKKTILTFFRRSQRVQ